MRSLAPFRLPAAPIALAILTACGDSAGPANRAQVSLAIATRPSVATGAAAAVTVPPVTFTDGTNTLVIARVQLVVREIELERAGSAACGNGGGDCQELELGPILLDLPLGAGAALVLSAPVAAGTYGEVDLEIHPPSDDDPEDAAFRQAHPELAGTSVKVIGSYNGGDFTYTGDLEAQAEVALDPPVAASDSGTTALTLLVDLDPWFRDAAGTLVDPATAGPGQPNAALVVDNVRAALRAFEDEDRDGADDRGE